jgi:hypothetical protein
MSRKWKMVIFMSIISIGWIFGFYGWYLPNYIEENADAQRDVIEMSGYKPIEQVEVSGWTNTAVWKVSKTDSLGNPKEKLIDVRLRKGDWIVQPH